MQVRAAKSALGRELASVPLNGVLEFIHQRLAQTTRGRKLHYVRYPVDSFADTGARVVAERREEYVTKRRK
jgi:hypothetical protein